MLRKFFDLADKMEPATIIMIGSAVIICMFAGFAAHMIISAREAERG